MLIVKTIESSSILGMVDILKNNHKTTLGFTNGALPNQALPARKQRDFAESAQQASSACPED